MLSPQAARQEFGVVRAPGQVRDGVRVPPQNVHGLRRGPRGGAPDDCRPVLGAGRDAGPGVGELDEPDLVRVLGELGNHDLRDVLLVPQQGVAAERVLVKRLFPLGVNGLAQQLPQPCLGHHDVRRDAGLDAAEQRPACFPEPPVHVDLGELGRGRGLEQVAAQLADAPPTPAEAREPVAHAVEGTLGVARVHELEKLLLVEHEFQVLAALRIDRHELREQRLRQVPFALFDVRAKLCGRRAFELDARLGLQLGGELPEPEVGQSLLDDSDDLFLLGAAVQLGSLRGGLQHRRAGRAGRAGFAGSPHIAGRCEAPALALLRAVRVVHFPRGLHAAASRNPLPE